MKKSLLIIVLLILNVTIFGQFRENVGNFQNNHPKGIFSQYIYSQLYFKLTDGDTHYIITYDINDGYKEEGLDYNYFLQRDVYLYRNDGGDIHNPNDWKLASTEPIRIDEGYILTGKSEKNLVSSDYMIQYFESFGESNDLILLMNPNHDSFIKMVNGVIYLKLIVYYGSSRKTPNKTDWDDALRHNVETYKLYPVGNGMYSKFKPE